MNVVVEGPKKQLGGRSRVDLTKCINKTHEASLNCVQPHRCLCSTVQRVWLGCGTFSVSFIPHSEYP